MQNKTNGVGQNENGKRFCLYSRDEQWTKHVFALPFCSPTYFIANFFPSSAPVLFSFCAYSKGTPFILFFVFSLILGHFSRYMNARPIRMVSANHCTLWIGMVEQRTFNGILYASFIVYFTCFSWHDIVLAFCLIAL